MASKDIQGVTLECVQGDIANQPDMDAVVNAANAQLLPGGGVAGALHRAAGPGLAEECRPLAPIQPGEAVISGAHNLPNSHVIHCLGPVYGRDKPEEKLLASCYAKALRLADDNGLSSIAFPAISSGAFGYPFQAAARIALRTTQDTIPDLASVKHVRFVLFSQGDAQVYETLLQEMN
ncbi:MAG: macro domain-containing protein [Desulfovermiculus sp.]|nr:macro domain-containing protein [Desulfovermiculus sp.]